jgi:hypothetical protein
MTPLTASKLDQALAALRDEQARGEAPPPGEVSRAELARRAGVCEATIAHIERTFRARLAAALISDPSTPAHLTSTLSRHIQP